MGARKKQQPTKIQAVFMGVLALLMLTNTATSVLLEGRPATVFFWIVMALNLGLLGLSFWLYRKAMKVPQNVD